MWITKTNKPNLTAHTYLRKTIQTTFNRLSFPRIHRIGDHSTSSLFCTLVLFYQFQQQTERNETLGQVVTTS